MDDLYEEFQLKYGGTPQPLASGMHRDANAGKVDYTLVMDGPMFKRWASHLTLAVPVHGERNWLKANSKQDVDHFKASAMRHFVQWFYGDRSEDHAAALFFNVNGVEYVTEQGGSK